MDFILKLKMDCFHIGRIHSDWGHEFSGLFLCWLVHLETILERMDVWRWQSKVSRHRFVGCLNKPMSAVGIGPWLLAMPML